MARLRTVRLEALSGRDPQTRGANDRLRLHQLRPGVAGEGRLADGLSARQRVRGSPRAHSARADAAALEPRLVGLVPKTGTEKPVTALRATRARDREPCGSRPSGGP